MSTPQADALTKALNAHLSKSTRSEDLERYEDFFVAVEGTDQLLDSGCQVIYGRGGTGKTLLIGAINERCRSEAKLRRVASVSFTASSFDYSPDYGIEATPRERTHVYFQMFIEQLCTEIVALADELIEQPNWWAALSIAGEQALIRREKLFRLCIDLLDAAKYGVTIAKPSDITETRRLQHTSNAERQFGAQVKVDASSPSVALGASLSGSRTSGNSSTTDESATTGRAYSPHKVRELISAIIDTLGLDHLVVFIDEWMTLYDCQVAFAERLKKSLFHERRIAVKIATDQYMSTFNNSGEGTNFRGIDVGRDLFIALDLDEPFSSTRDQEEFFAQALYRRLWVFNPALESQFGDPPLTNSDRFIDAMFANRNAFRHACRASHGICRDFYEIVRQSFKRSGGDVGLRKIAIYDVRGAIGGMTTPIYDRVNQRPTARAMLYNVITPHIRRTRSRYFATATDQGSYKARLNNLLSKRVIHKVQQDAIHPTLRGQYEIWEINAGVFADLMHAVEFTTGEKVDDSFRDGELASIAETSLSTYLLALGEVKSDESVELLMCPDCQREFPSTHKAYLLRHICPFCYAIQPEEDGAEA